MDQKLCVSFETIDRGIMTYHFPTFKYEVTNNLTVTHTFRKHLASKFCCNNGRVLKNHLHPTLLYYHVYFPILFSLIGDYVNFINNSDTSEFQMKVNKLKIM
jgi:hypothetical protein